LIPQSLAADLIDVYLAGKLALSAPDGRPNQIESNTPVEAKDAGVSLEAQVLQRP